jgi:hypothetical protein
MGHLSLVQAVAALASGLFAAGAGGAIGGVLVGGEALGRSLATMMGVFFGLVGGGLAAALGVIALMTIG